MATTAEPHYRCGIGRKRIHGRHMFRALLMNGTAVVRLYCPGFSGESDGDD